MVNHFNNANNRKVKMRACTNNHDRPAINADFGTAMAKSAPTTELKWVWQIPLIPSNISNILQNLKAKTGGNIDDESRCALVKRYKY